MRGSLAAMEGTGLELEDPGRLVQSVFGTDYRDEVREHTGLGSEVVVSEEVAAVVAVVVEGEVAAAAVGPGVRWLGGHSGGR